MSSGGWDPPSVCVSSGGQEFCPQGLCGTLPTGSCPSARRTTALPTPLPTPLVFPQTTHNSVLLFLPHLLAGIPNCPERTQCWFLVGVLLRPFCLLSPHAFIHSTNLVLQDLIYVFERGSTPRRECGAGQSSSQADSLLNPSWVPGSIP